MICFFDVYGKKDQEFYRDPKSSLTDIFPLFFFKANSL